MFEAEAKTPDQQIEAAYYAMLALDRRFGPEELEQEPILAGSASEPGPDEQELARHWIEEIQRVEKKPIRELESEKIEKYVVKLATRVEQLVRGQSNLDPKQRRRLSKELRHELSLSRFIAER